MIDLPIRIIFGDAYEMNFIQSHEFGFHAVLPTFVDFRIQEILKVKYE